MKLNEIKKKYPPITDEIKNKLHEYKIDIYDVNDDNSLSIRQDVLIIDYDIEKLPFKIKNIEGDLHVSTCYKLKSLENFPDTISARFTLQDCDEITSLKHCPSSVGHFVLYNCHGIKSLKNYLPISRSGFEFPYCINIESLEGLPNDVSGSLNIRGVNLHSLKGMPETLDGSLIMTQVLTLMSFDYLPKKIDGNIYIDSFSNHVKNYLALFKVKGLRMIRNDNKTLEKIINKHLKTGDMIECQEELIDAGLKQFARLK